jgi:REP element-mobilizing transposase RayT
MEGATYFVTWRLAASQPVLTGDERTVVADSIKYFAGTRYDLFAFVVMDDHVHAIVTPLEEVSLQEIVHSWKSFSANRFQRDFRRHGTIWQDECFDRIIRDERELLEKANYILGNPARRWPELEEYEWVGCGSSMGMT